MDNDQKEKLFELIVGIREPTDGMEKHFLQVIKRISKPCTPLEKEWFQWWKDVTLKQQIVKEKKLPPTISINEKSKDILDRSSDDSQIRIKDLLVKFAKERRKNNRIIILGGYGTGKKRKI